MAKKSLLQTAGDGTSIPAGFLGEKITWSTPPSTTSVSTSEADWSNATFQLTPGVWQIFLHVQALALSSSSSNANARTFAKVTDSSNNVVQNLEGLVGATAILTNVAVQNISFISMSGVVSIASNTTYKVRIVRTESVAGCSGTVYNESGLRSHFYAIRIS